MNMLAWHYEQEVPVERLAQEWIGNLAKGQSQSWLVEESACQAGFLPNNQTMIV
ncbi:hypothetical protein [Paenibacillus sp. y28]|uniref:hypothetical protein n=1 Tax=Paenibacillus sp. y28 TaxID=3129110 RepID=UPI00301B5A97